MPAETLESSGDINQLGDRADPAVEARKYFSIWVDAAPETESADETPQADADAGESPEGESKE